MNILLDTCCFLWLAFESERLSPKASKMIEDESNTLFLSDVSLWEICLRHRSGKLPLPLPPAGRFPSRRGFFNLSSLRIDETAILLTPDTPLSRLGAARLW